MDRNVSSLGDGMFAGDGLVLVNQPGFFAVQWGVDHLLNWSKITAPAPFWFFEDYELREKGLAVVDDFGSLVTVERGRL